MSTILSKTSGSIGSDVLFIVTETTVSRVYSPGVEYALSTIETPRTPTGTCPTLLVHQNVCICFWYHMLCYL